MREKKNLTIAQVIRKRRNDLATRKGYLSLFSRVILLAAVGYLIVTKVFLFAQATGSGMFPAVKDGDLMIAFRLQSEYAKNDVIVYDYAGKLCVGRIAAREGDVVYPRDAVTYPLTVPAGCVFVLGDYRTISEDSRDFGPVAMTQVEGKVITILRRRGL